MNERPRPLRCTPSNRAEAIPRARPAGTSSAAWRGAAVAFVIAALGSLTGCYEWRPIRATGAFDEKLNKQLEGESIRYDLFSKTVVARVVAARTPYVDVRGPRDPVTGERQIDTLDLRDLNDPEVKVVNRPLKIAAIVGGSTAAAVLIGVLIGVMVSNEQNTRSSRTLDINWGHYD